MFGDSRYLPSSRTFRRIWKDGTPRFCLSLVVGLIFLFNSGCTSFGDYVRNGFKVGPNYQKPPAPVASDWIDSKAKGVSVVSKDLTEWWAEFKDPKLNALIAEAQNLTLRRAGTRILAARARSGFGL